MGNRLLVSWACFVALLARSRFSRFAAQSAYNGWRFNRSHGRRWSLIIQNRLHCVVRLPERLMALIPAHFATQSTPVRIRKRNLTSNRQRQRSTWFVCPGRLHCCKLLFPSSTERAIFLSIESGDLRLFLHPARSSVSSRLIAAPCVCTDCGHAN